MAMGSGRETGFGQGLRSACASRTGSVGFNNREERTSCWGLGGLLMADTAKTLARGAGVVTFLDVLGWKGVYERKKDALNSLALIVDGLRGQSEQQRGRITGEISVK